MGAKSLMIQGTMSGVGKSLLVAGLCRVLAQDGVRVAPFKSQNMALNSAITADGLEIGRAQAMQAEAAGIDPTAAMNPVLLKPTTDTGSQVILHGKPLGTMQAREYFRFRHTLKEPIMKAYRELQRDYDVILIEGAGSPVELNLKRDDIVNMGLARMTSSPVVLAGDIDRGGVFAQLVGTLMLLEDDERRLVKATIVNKFRGDPTLFSDGMRILRERTGLPVAGLMPYVQVDLEDEDSVSERLNMRGRRGLVDIAVIRLPKISNFTDFIALEAVEGVGVRYVEDPHELGHPDLVIIPGTKATLADLRWMRTTGMEVAVVRVARSGVPVLGICGGYQMLGEAVIDPRGMEGGGEERGLGLLPVRTTFCKEKRQTQVAGSFMEVEGPLSVLAGTEVRGYEIHMGLTERTGGAPLLRLRDLDGEVTEDGCQAEGVYGTYLHGLFDTEGASTALVRALLRAKGLDSVQVSSQDMRAYKQRQFDVLADGIRANLNMRLIYDIIEKGV